MRAARVSLKRISSPSLELEREQQFLGFPPTDPGDNYSRMGHLYSKSLNTFSKEKQNYETLPDNEREGRCNQWSLCVVFVIVDYY